MGACVVTDGAVYVPRMNAGFGKNLTGGVSIEGGFAFSAGSCEGESGATATAPAVERAPGGSSSSMTADGGTMGRLSGGAWMPAHARLAGRGTPSDPDSQNGRRTQRRTGLRARSRRW